VRGEALTLAIAAAVKRPGTTPGDVAVLVPTNTMVAEYTSLISGLGFPTQKLFDYEGVRNSRVKVGTYQRSKGLEFKAVFLPRLDPQTLREDRQTNEDADTHAERVDLLARNIYVGMTRARDDLWCGWASRLLCCVAGRTRDGSSPWGFADGEPASGPLGSQPRTSVSPAWRFIAARRHEVVRPVATGLNQLA